MLYLAVIFPRYLVQREKKGAEKKSKFWYKCLNFLLVFKVSSLNHSDDRSDDENTNKIEFITLDEFNSSENDTNPKNLEEKSTQTDFSNFIEIRYRCTECTTIYT